MFLTFLMDVMMVGLANSSSGLAVQFWIDLVRDDGVSSVQILYVRETI